MVAIGIGAPIYVIIQAVIARFVYREASAHNRRSPLVVAVSVFVLSIMAVFVIHILLILLAQSVVIALYRLGTSRNQPAPQ